MKCTNCGEEVPDTAMVCGYCGLRLKLEKVPPTIVEEKPILKKKKTLAGLWISLGVILLIIVTLVIIGSLRRMNPPDFQTPEPVVAENNEIIVAQETELPQVVVVEPTPYLDTSLMPDVLIHYVGTPGLEVVEHFNNLTDNEWYYSDNVSLVDLDGNRLEVPGLPDLQAYFCSPEFEPGHGILTKIRMSGPSPRMEFFVNQNKWNSPEYRRFGGVIYDSNQMETTIWDGLDNSLSNQEMNGALRTLEDNWYGLFVGGDTNGKFIFILWNLDNPKSLSSYSLEKGEAWSTGLWYSCFQVDTGTLYLDDYSIVTFDHIN